MMKSLGMFVLGIVVGIAAIKTYERLVEETKDSDSLASEIESRLDALEVGA